MRFAHSYPDKRDKKFLPSLYEGPGFIDEEHPAIIERVAEVRGKLLGTDHVKLYEAAYFCRSRILEVGRLYGKSTVIMGLAARRAGHNAPITTIDLPHRQSEIARRNIETFELTDTVTFVDGDSSTTVADLDGSFDTVFIDGDHSYDGVAKDVRALEGHLEPGAIVLFHDFWDGRNDDPNSPFGVRSAVEDNAEAVGLEFRGGFGALGVYEYVH